MRKNKERKDEQRRVKKKERKKEIWKERKKDRKIETTTATK